MKTIVAIGGGELRDLETLLIDRAIVKLSKKKHPKALFIPTASNDAVGYWETFQNVYGKKLGCETDVLFLIHERLSKKQIEEKILSADIVYVGGGNTLRMLRVWKKYGVDKLLWKAYEKGIVLSGVSAGAICWFKYGNSDSLKFSNKNSKMIRVKGLGIIDLLLCPHFDVEKKRKAELKRIMKKTNYLAIAIDNCAAIEIINNKYRVISSKKNANVYATYWKNGKYLITVINKRKELVPLNKIKPTNL